MRRVTVALVAGLTLLAITIGLVLAHAPMTVARTNRPAGQPEEPIAISHEYNSYCQAGETLPQGTSALRVWLDTIYGPRVAVAVSSHGRRLASGERGSGWVSGSVTIPVKPLPRTVSDVTVCVSFRARDETVVVQGNETPAASATREGGRALPGRMWIEYLRRGQRSWGSLISSTARRMGLGRAAAGIWVVFLAIGLAASVILLAAMLVVKELP
jgi:hypothetical protein